jgi:pentatricopeptide repeat protein
MCRVAALVHKAANTEEAIVAALRHTTSPDVLTLSGLTKLISRLHKSQHWQKALRVFDALPQVNITADLPLCNAALGACGAGRDTARAELLFCELEESGLQPDAISINALGIAAGRANDCHACAVVRLRGLISAQRVLVILCAHDRLRGFACKP